MAAATVGVSRSEEPDERGERRPLLYSHERLVHHAINVPRAVRSNGSPVSRRQKVTHPKPDCCCTHLNGSVPNSVTAIALSDTLAGRPSGCVTMR